MKAIDLEAADNSSIVGWPERWFPSSSFLYRRRTRWPQTWSCCCRRSQDGDPTLQSRARHNDQEG
jgi:hypothetical protein